MVVWILNRYKVRSVMYETHSPKEKDGERTVRVV